jgi:DNA-binding MarR family transcriptional regulator
MSCRPLSSDEGAVFEALMVRPATIDRLAEKLGWDTARVTAVVDRLRADGFVFGADHLELSGSGRFHLPSEKDRRIDPS